jgi:hypothetical protein
MNPIIMTLTFSSIMLIFMAFPAMRIVAWIKERKEISPRLQNILTVIITIILSLGVGIFLEFV